MPLDLSLISTADECWKKLEQTLRLNGETEIEDIHKCFSFALEAHDGQYRESGEPYITHPAWIALVVAQLGFGKETIEAALLHDCIEDTNITSEEIAENFGDEVALLVEGLTDVSKKTKGFEIHYTSIEVFRNFLFSSVNDVRVLIIRIIDKLHNGLTINSLSQERQIKFAKRAMGIYGPVAEYVGLHYFKRIIEDISFKILNPKEAKEIEELIDKNSKIEKKALALIKYEIEETLRLNNINNYLIEGRIKSLYSTYLKYHNKGKDRVKDRVGIRVITENVQDCYMVLGLLHAKYQYLAEEFNDYISAPKPNGYRSIQTTLCWKEGLTVEVQIRTKTMHDFNEFGPASHIAYKMRNNNLGMGYEWIRDLVKWQKSEKDVENYRINVLTKYIYVFTPKGDTIQLPSGSTALDFAYKIHSQIGNHCNGAMVNYKMTKIDTELKTGDMVEILTSKKINVNKNWLRFVKTNWAKERIRHMTQENES